MKAVGARLPRYDGVAHVTGRTEFVDDVRVPSMLWAKALRSPVHHAEITSSTRARRQAMKGVHAIVTWEDVPRIVYGHLEALGIPADEPLLAEDEVRYKGQPIALVAAEDEETAQLAAEAIEVEFEERPALFDIRKAVDPDAPQIHHWGNWYPHFEGEMDVRQIRKGDIDDAFDQADTIVSGVYRPAAIEHVPMETQIALVVPEPDGRLTIYSCTQALYFSMGVVAAHLQVPLNRLKFVGGTVGGGFGGKVDTATETSAAPARAQGGPTGEVAVDARGGVPLLLHPRAVAHRDRGRGHRGRLDPRTQDADAARLGRVRAVLAVRRDEAQLPPHRRVHDPEPPLRRLRRLHEPGAHDGDARLRRHLGLVRDRDPHESHRGRARARPVRVPAEEREPDRRHLAERHRSCDPSTVPTIQAIADAIGHELPADYRTMTREPRSGDLLPEHLVAQQVGEVDH